MTHKRKWAEEIYFTDDMFSQCWDDEQADQWESMSWDQHKDHTVLWFKLQSASVFKVSRIQSQDVWMQKQVKMHSLHAELLLEALFLQTNSKYWKYEACWNTYKVFDSQCHKQQVEKERIKRVTKHRSLYQIVWRQKELKIVTSKIFTETFISLKLLINNDLKRKQRHLINESHLLSVIITSENIILNHLIKKSRSNELKLTSITLLLMSSSVKNFTSEANALQTLKRTLNSLKCKL